MPAVPQVETFAEVAQDSIQHITHDCVYNNRVFIYIYLFIYIYIYGVYRVCFHRIVSPRAFEPIVSSGNYKSLPYKSVATNVSLPWWRRSKRCEGDRVDDVFCPVFFGVPLIVGSTHHFGAKPTFRWKLPWPEAIWLLEFFGLTIIKVGHQDLSNQQKRSGKVPATHDPFKLFTHIWLEISPFVDNYTCMFGTGNVSDFCCNCYFHRLLEWSSWFCRWHDHIMIASDDESFWKKVPVWHHSHSMGCVIDFLHGCFQK